MAKTSSQTKDNVVSSKRKITATLDVAVPEKLSKNMTYGEDGNQFLSDSVLSATTMEQLSYLRNVHAIGEKAERNATMVKLLRDPLLAKNDENGIVYTQAKGPYSMTVKFTSHEVADDIVEKLEKKYGKSIAANEVTPRKPQIKIYRLFTAETCIEELTVRLLRQNPWIDIAKFEINRT